MINLTKEDLEEISFCLHAYPHSDDNHIYDPLRAKIKSMIDSYCEHEPSTIGICAIERKRE
jgi:hypothetical protein